MTARQLVERPKRSLSVIHEPDNVVARRDIAPVDRLRMHPAAADPEAGAAISAMSTRWTVASGRAPPRADGTTPQQLAVTRSVVVANMLGVAVAFTRGRWGAIWGAPVTGNAQRVAAVGDFAFWEDWNGPIRIAVGSLDQPPQWLRDIAPGRVRKFHTDGVDLAWVEIQDSPPTLELYTAPVVFTAAELAPRRVGPIEGIQFTGMGGGWYVLLKADPERIEIIELATGRTKTWFAAPGELITGNSPTYVSATEIATRARRADGNNYWLRLDPRSVPWDE